MKCLWSFLHFACVHFTGWGIKFTDNKLKNFWVTDVLGTVRLINRIHTVSRWRTQKVVWPMNTAILKGFDIRLVMKSMDTMEAWRYSHFTDLVSCLKLKALCSPWPPKKVFWLKKEAADATAAKSFFFFLSQLTLFSLETLKNCTGPKDEVKIILKRFAIKTCNCISLLAIQNLIREFWIPSSNCWITPVWQNEGDWRTAPVVGEFLSFSCDDSCWRVGGLEGGGEV